MSRRASRKPGKAPRSDVPLRVAAKQPAADSLAAAPRALNPVAAASALAALVVYVATLNPTVSHGDSGEMISAAYTLGVAHPPGFPLYVLLAKLATLLPVASVAWRVNLLSALCGAGATFFLCRAVGRWTASLSAGILAAGTFAFSPIVWPYAVTAEVFALNNLFVALLLDLTTSAARQRPSGAANGWLLAATFAFFLGLSNHQILLLVAGPALVWLLVRQVRQAGGGVPVAHLLLAATAGLLPYAYLLAAPRLGSEIVWGDTATPGGFVAHVLRSDYGTFQLASGPRATGADVAERLFVFLRAIGAGTLWTAPLFLAASLPALFRPSPLRGLWRAWVVGLGAHVLVFAGLANLSLQDAVHLAVQQRFWQQALLLLAALMGLGLAQGARLGGRLGSPLAVAISLALPLALLLSHYREMDQREHVFFREYGRAIIEPLPQGATLVITSDEAIGSVRYLQQVEANRRDVRVLPAGQLASPWFRAVAARHMPGLRIPPPGVDGAFTFRAFLDLNLPQTRVFLVNRVPWEQTLEEAYALWPVGLADEVLPRGATPALAPWTEQASASFSIFDPATQKGHVGAWERYVETGRWKQVERFGLALARVAAGAGADPAVARIVTRTLAPLVDRHPAPPPVLLRNLGVAYQYLATQEPDARTMMVRCWRRYLEVAAPADPDRALIEKALAQSGATP